MDIIRTALVKIQNATVEKVKNERNYEMENFKEILPQLVFVTILSGYAAFKVKHMINDGKKKTIYFGEVPAPIKCPKRKIDKTGIKKEASRTIDEFVSKMEENGFDLSNFYRNFHSRMIMTVPHTDGFYDEKEGRLIVSQEDVRSSLLRGLLDLSTTISTDKITATGFERTFLYGQNKKPLKRYGYGLNEGYKEVLLWRMFSIRHSYKRVTELALLIEYLVGKKKMQSLYLTGNLQTLVYILNGNAGNYSISQRWICTLDNLFDAVYLDDPIKSVTVNKAYRDMLISLAIAVAKEAKSLYFTSYNITENRARVYEMLKSLNSTLETRKKIPFLPGLSPTNISYLSEEIGKTLKLLPHYYQINL